MNGSRMMAEPELRAPRIWTASWVRKRLIEAFEVDRRLPRAHTGNGGNGSWPAILHTFADLVGWSDRRTRVRMTGALAFEVTRMDEAFAWFTILARYPLERESLEVWASNASSLTREIQKRGWKRSTFYRRVEDGSTRIAAVLNQRGVMVR